MKNRQNFMTTEAKAKAYDEALERARMLNNGKDVDVEAGTTTCEYIFPELKESEDEKIRKELPEFINHYRHNNDLTSEQAEWCHKAIAWLEKQKEQKPLEYLPKEKVYDIMSKLTNLSLSYNIPIEEYEKIDEIKSNVRDLLDYPIEQKPAKWSEEDEKMLLSIINAFRNGAMSTIGQEQWLKSLPERFNLQPQIKQEQKEQKLHLTVSGKEVYKICPRCKSRMIRDDSKVYNSMPPQYGYECPKCGEMEFDTVKYDSPEMEEQKSAEDWREKRKEECPFRRNLDNNLYGCERYAGLISGCNGICSWVVDYPKLKEIQDKQEQKPAEWNEEDKEALDMCLDAIPKKWKTKSGTLLTKWLKDNIHLKQEWSEEDEYLMNETIQHLEQLIRIDKAKHCGVDVQYYQRDIAWLKSLRPQPHWKPSEEQMKALEYASHGWKELEINVLPNKALQSLYNDLMKL